jgi:hypothetical protein
MQAPVRSCSFKILILLVKVTMWGFKRSRFFTPRPLKFRESANKRWEAGFMVFVVEPCFVPSLKRSLHRKVKEADTRAGLETHAPITLRLATLGWYFKKSNSSTKGS